VSLVSPPAVLTSTMTHPDPVYTNGNDTMSPASSSASEGPLSDPEEDAGAQQESISTPESGDQDEVVSSASSDEGDDGGQSEDGDYEIETPAEEAADDHNDDSDDSDIPVKSAGSLRRAAKSKPVDDFHENPDLYGLRRSVGYLLQIF